MTRARLALVLACTAMLGVPCALHAQDARGGDARLETHLDTRTRMVVVALIDSVRLAHIPTEPLIEKALEGASKKADGPRIVAAVRALAAQLAVARTALGAEASDAEVTAGAAALHAGVSSAVLERLRAARPHGSLTVALAVMADIVARGVPSDTAASTIAAMTRAGARESDLLAFRQDVERDIALGATPAAAASVRARASVPDGVIGVPRKP